MVLVDLIKRIISNEKRRLNREVDLNSPENEDLIEDPKLLSNILKANIYLKDIKVSPQLSEEHKRVLRKYAPKKHYTYKAKKVLEYMTGYENIYTVKDKKTTFSQYQKAEKIYEKIITGMEPNWNDISKFKYIYNQLAMHISYDYSVLSELNDEIENMYRAENNATNIFSSILTRKGICIGVSEAYEYLCKKANLNCEIEVNLPMEHAYNIITYKNAEGKEEKSYCDLTFDLQRIKRGEPCKNFAKSSKEFAENHSDIKYDDLIGIDDTELCRVDSEIGYISKDGEYGIDKYVNAIKELNSINSNEEKTNAALNKMMELGKLKHMSDYEVIAFARLLLDNLDLPEVGLSILFTRNKEDIKDTKGVLWIKESLENKDRKEKYLYYVFNKQQQQFKSLDSEIIEELLASGMIEFYANTKLPGFENWGSERQMKDRLKNSVLDR